MALWDNWWISTSDDEYSYEKITDEQKKLIVSQLLEAGYEFLRDDLVSGRYTRERGDTAEISFSNKRAPYSKNHNEAYRIIESALGRPFFIPYKGQENTYFFWPY